MKRICSLELHSLHVQRTIQSCYIVQVFIYDRTHYMHRKSGNSDCTNQYHGGDNIKIQNKSLLLDSLLKVLKEKSWKDDVHVGNIRETLADMSQDDVSPQGMG